MSSARKKQSRSGWSKGKIVIISSPSGGGKTSICRKLLSPTRRKLGWQFSVSYTTRKRRPGERDGHAYHFVDDKKFNDMARRDFFAEHCKVHLYKYGTPRSQIEKVLNKGGVLLLDVDVQGAVKLKKKYPEAISIFVLPPSVAALKKRLRKRGTETTEQLKVRFEIARSEMATVGSSRYGFEYVVINKELNTAVSEVLAIVSAHHCRIENMNKELMNRITR